VACIIGDGEAETASLATSWQSNKFLDPITDGAVLPILHLKWLQDQQSNRFWPASSTKSWNNFCEAAGWTPYFVEGDEPEKMHELMAAALEAPSKIFVDSKRTHGTITTRPGRAGP